MAYGDGVRRPIAKELQKIYPRFTVDEILYIMNDQVDNIKHAFTHKLDIKLSRIGSFRIKDGNRSYIDFIEEYLDEHNIDRESLNRDAYKALVSDIAEKKKQLATHIREGVPTEILKEIVKNRKKSVK